MIEKLKFAFNWLRGLGRDAVAKYPEVSFWVIVALFIVALF